MRDWQFHLTTQLRSGLWFLRPSDIMGMSEQLLKLFGPDQDLKLFTSDLKEVRGSLPILSYSEGYENTSMYDQLPAGSIAIFKISGTMFKYGTYWSYGTEEIAQQMIAAANHKNIAGALIIGDSGGGGVNSISPLLVAREYFKRLGKPVVGLFDSCYSAMYYFACTLDRVFLCNDISAGAGSIGVMMSWFDFVPYYESLNIKHHIVIPEESSEKNAAIELALKGQYDRIKKEQLSPLAIGFQNHVKANRSGKLIIDENEIVIKGQTYFAKQSVEIGLVDGIRTQEQAIQEVFDLIEVQKFLKS
jgi:protease-4